MKILYLGYWGVNDVLTQAVIYPRLHILATHRNVSSVLFCSVERKSSGGSPQFKKATISHIGLSSKKGAGLLLTKFYDFTVFPGALKKIIKEKEIDLVICNSPLAGTIGYLATRQSTVPLVVECFEPHADYMLESGVWKEWDPRFLILKHYERKLRGAAQWLLTVSENYRKKLLQQGVSAQKIKVLPNAVDLQKFSFNAQRRSITRKELNIPVDGIVGIYVGKFGGIYYDAEAFELFAAAAAFFGDRFRLILLSADDHGSIRERLTKVRLPVNRVTLLSVAHDVVPDYLSAADFAFATIKPAPSRIYCCPVKDGEYWANGLPILLENGIGDDSEIVRREGGGVIFDHGNPQPGFTALDDLMRTEREDLARQIMPVAAKHRDMSLIRSVYESILNA